MLAMARALATDPKVLLLDELSMGLAPLIVEELYEVVKRIAEDDVSILVVEQFAHEVLGVADVAAIMLHGRIAVHRRARPRSATPSRPPTWAARSTPEPHRLQQHAAAYTKHTTAPISTARARRATSAIAPIQMPPIGIRPAHVTREQAMIRPRLSSSARCWSTVFSDVVIEK